MTIPRILLAILLGLAALMQLPAGGPGGPGGKNNGGNGVWIVPRATAAAGLLAEISQGTGAAYERHEGVSWSNGLTFRLPAELSGYPATLTDPVSGVSTSIVGRGMDLHVSRETLQNFYSIGVRELRLVCVNNEGVGVGVLIRLVSDSTANFYLY